MTNKEKTAGRKSTSLSFVDRVRGLFYQDDSSVIFRQNNRITRHNIKEFFGSAERKEQLRFFDDAAAFCEIMYAGQRKFNSKGIARINNDELEVSTNWKEMTSLPHLDTWRQRLISFDQSLKIRVWINKVDKKVMIVFRGTSTPQEWFVNFRWVTLMPFRAIVSMLTATKFNQLGLIWDHYDIVQNYIPLLVAEIKKQFDSKDQTSVEIITTGHSLGGGLAQHAAYASPEIKKVLAFHPSPVTGYFCIPYPARQINKKGVHIIQAYEKGEILAYARFLTRLFNPLTKLVLPNEDPLVEELRFNFMQDDTIKEHNMAPFRHDLEAILQSVSSVQ